MVREDDLIQILWIKENWLRAYSPSLTLSQGCQENGMGTSGWCLFILLQQDSPELACLVCVASPPNSSVPEGKKS